MVTTSFSAAPLQMGRDCERQKARLHWLHEGLVVWARRPPLRRILVWKRCSGDSGRSETGVVSSGWATSSSLVGAPVSSEEESGGLEGVEGGFSSPFAGEEEPPSSLR